MKRNGHKHAANGNGRKRLGLSREELSRELDALSGSGGLSQEPLDGELWPTEGLSDDQIKLLTEKLRKVRDKV